MNETRVKVFTRSFDLRLYRMAKGLFASLGYPCVRLTDQSADGYFYTMLRDQDCDIAVNIDEDAFLVDPQAVRDLVKRVAEEGWANAGYSDGDPATTGRNEIVTNPFFNVLNLRLIRTEFDRSQIRPRSFEDAEPYYPFFFWISDHFRTLYLPCRRHEDGITTVAMDEEGRVICLHTWFSRFYSMPSWLVRRIEPTQGMQKSRIDAVIAEAYRMRGLDLPHFGVADRMAFAGNKVLRWIVKVPQRVARWPYKFKRMMARRRNTPHASGTN